MLLLVAKIRRARVEIGNVCLPKKFIATYFSVIFFFSFPEGGFSVKRPKALRVRIVRIFRICVDSVGLTNLMLTIPHGRRPMMMRSGVNLARHSLVSVEWPWLLPLSLVRQPYRNWRSLPPPIRSMEAACTKASGRTASTPRLQTGRNTHISPMFICSRRTYVV